MLTTVSFDPTTKPFVAINFNVERSSHANVCDMAPPWIEH